MDTTLTKSKPPPLTDEMKQHFKTSVVSWLSIDGEIAALQSQIKELRNRKKKDIEPEIMDFMKTYNISDLNTQNGRLKYSETNVKKGLNKKVLLKSGLVSSKRIASDQIYDKYRKRLIFPIFNYLGKICGFGGRALSKDQMPKYLNSPETPIYNKSKTLYGLYQNSQNIRNSKRVILVEGYMDLLQLVNAGITDCLAISGTAFTPGHANILKRYTSNIHICFDGDDAGNKAALRCGYTLAQNSIEPKITSPPNGMDPDDWVREKGKDEFNSAIQNSESVIKFHYNYSSKKSTIGSLSIRNFIQDSLDELLNIEDPIIQELMIKELSDLTKVDQKNITHVLSEKYIKRNRFKKRQPTEIENEELLSSEESLSSQKDVTINLEYSGTDNRGNFYKILSKYSETNVENSSLINLKGVSAVINLFDGRTITIRSDSALYDQSNNDTRFKGNVIINEKFNSIKAENADLYFSKNLINIFENVEISNDKALLKSDKLDINLLKGFAKFSMNKKNQKVNIKIQN